MAQAVVSLVTVVAGIVAAASALAPAAHAADTPFDVNTTAPTWDAAAARLGTAGSLWEPARVLGMTRRPSVAVVADNLAFSAGVAVAGDTYAGARYRDGARSIWIDEKWANTGWAAEPVVTTSRALVERVPIRLGSPGTRVTVTARVSADCFPQPTDADPRPVPKRFRCTRADVLRTGGTLELTARPVSQMTAPGRTTIVIRSAGLTFGELVRIAGSLEQVAGTPVAGSAQMVAMCGQMVDGRMTFDQASAFAASNGYSARVGSIDGQPQPVTMDYRPDRFTVALVSDVVTGCTYG